jgi:hypothetical protein
MKSIRKAVDALLVLIQSIFISLAFLTFSPASIPTPHRDSGIFLFIGSQILKGKVLYRQTWDNKQPLLYVLNAIGLWLGRGSAWGVWAVELAIFVAALSLLYFILRKKFAPLISLLIPLVSFLTIYQIMSGNFSEEYSICFQSAVIGLLFLVYLPDQRRFSRPIAAVGMGLLAGISFGLKQTYLDVFFSAAVFLFFLAWMKKDRQILFHLLWMLGGFAVVNLLIVLYFAAHGALQDYIINAYLINKYYSSQGLLEWLRAFLKTFLFLKTYPLLGLIGLIGLGGVIFVLVKLSPSIVRGIQHQAGKWIFLILGLLGFGFFGFSLYSGKESGIGLLQGTLLGLSCLALLICLFLFIRKPTAVGNQEPLRSKLNQLEWSAPGAPVFLFLGLIDLPVVMLTISLSGMNFNHYYISLFTALYLLLAAGCCFLYDLLAGKKPGLLFDLLSSVILIAGMVSPVMQIISRLQTPGSPDSRSETAVYLNSVTTPKDKILVWGWEAGIYYLADRQPPTRYAFQFPIYLQTPYQNEAATTLLSDLKADPPLYIADTVDSEMPFIQGMSMTDCLKANPQDGDTLQALLHYVCSNYAYEKSIGNINIYRLAR